MNANARRASRAGTARTGVREAGTASAVRTAATASRPSPTAATRCLENATASPAPKVICD